MNGSPGGSRRRLRRTVDIAAATLSLGAAGCGALLGLGIDDDPPDAATGSPPGYGPPGYGGYGDGATPDAGEGGTPPVDAGGDGDAGALAEHVAFVTRSTTNGSMAFEDDAGGGVARADQECTRDATDAGLSGTFVAWLSVAGANAATRVTPNVKYRLRSGKPLFTGSPGAVLPENPINEAATGEAQTDPVGRVWTGTSSAGIVDDNCSSWTISDDKAEGRTGTFAFDPKAEPARWTQDTRQSCGLSLPIYCFQK
jgi:hypothetical protein